MKSKSRRGRPPKRKETEDDVWFTTDEAIAAIQKNNEAEFEQSSPFGVVVLKKSYN
jgi:hypothetical protein